MGVDASNPHRQKVYLHFESYPTGSHLAELRDLDVTVYEDMWIPPLANHPTGFMIADIAVLRALSVAKLDFIKRMNSAEKFRFPHNNYATAGAKADFMWAQGIDGSGVVISILDSGLDSTHADIPTLVGGKDYYDWPNLDDTIEGAHPHGTHVSGSALGRGTLSGGTYSGSAPGADLVFLKIGGDATSSATEASMIAAYKASVDTYGVDIISVSYGGLNTYNDGSEEDCQTIDWVVEQGVLFLTSAGNSANDATHYSGTVGTKAASDTIKIQVDDNIVIPFLLTWYDGLGTNTDLELQFLDGSFMPITTTAYTQTQSDRGTESQEFESDLVASGTYYAVVTNNSPKSLASQDYHLYSYDYDAWFPVGADPNYTCIGGAVADEAISVGAWVSRGAWPAWTDWCGDNWYYNQPQDDITTFSSRGPRIDGAGPQLPFISAGGSALASCMDRNFSYSDWQVIDNDGLNLTCVGPADYIIMQGTSMACPIAAGVCALLLENNPDLTPSQVKQIIIDNATTDAYTGTVPNDTWGYGKIDAYIDLIAPSRINNLSVTSVTWNSVFLGWTAPGDDGTSGTATEYDIRYAETLPSKADTAAWWASATEVTGESTPQAYGTPESMEVTGLSPLTTYFFAIKALDEHYNPGDISDIIGEVTLAVTLSSFEANPVPEGILVEWNVESERNNRGYHLSRSLEEEGSFDFLVFLDGAGNSARTQTYSFVDREVDEGVTYWYLLESEDFQGRRATFGPIEVTVGRPLIPKKFALSQNYPNPFNPITHIKYQLPKDVPVGLRIYNVTGQEVVSLVDEVQKAGYYEVQWRGTDQHGRELASGVYFYRLDAGEHVFTRKMVLLK
jgi:subtilisin family serine protease